jgi:hypothetical protein
MRRGSSCSPLSAHCWRSSGSPHGDSHYYKQDKPLNSPSGKVFANFTRVETFGATNNHWVSATIDPKNPNLFVFEPRIVAANVG